MADLDDFLGEEPGQADASASADTGQAAAPEAPAPADVAGDGKPAAAPEGGAPAAPEAARAAEVAPAEPEDVTGLKSALQATRRERTDYKGRAERLEGEMTALKAQLAATQPPAAAPPAPVRQEPPAIPSPLEDPAGYHAYQERARFNERLNMSEVMVRAQHPDLDEKVAVFKRAMEANPGLRAELNRHVHPYQFVYEQGQRLMALEEIGPDPTAYRTKLEAEIRAKIEAEVAGLQPVQQGAAARVHLPQSLSVARSAAARSAPVMNVPEAFDDILAKPRK